MNNNIAISCSKISKQYILDKKYGSLRETLSGLFKPSRKENFLALDNVSFDIEQGTKVGIIGPNGAGKSTLLKVLSRITSPTKGRAIINGRLSSLLEVGTGFHHELSGRENIYLNGSLLGMSRKEIKEKEDEIIDFSGIEKYIDTPIKHYSSGMYVRLAFSVAAHLDSEILILDEVLAVGDADFKEKSFNFLNKNKYLNKTILLVSHDLTSIKKFCSKTLLLEKGKLVDYGDTNEVISKYISKESSPKIKRYKNSSLLDISYSTENNLEIIASYDFGEKPYLIPNLGFVLHDINGNNIFGTNAVQENRNLKKVDSKGKIKICILQPLLKTGEFYISIWFGDGLKDEIVDHYALKIKIERNNLLSPLGYIKPKLLYRFS